MTRRGGLLLRVRGMALAVALLLAGVARAEIEKADSLVGSTVIVKNVSRTSGRIAITRLQSDRDVAAVTKALQGALSKYPASFITRVLEAVYVGSSVTKDSRHSKEKWGGFYRYDEKSIYLAFNGDADQFEGVFHHELAHGIQLAFLPKFNEKAWLAANPPDFQYKENLDPHDGTPELLASGFVRPYAQSSILEDFACLAERVIGNPDAFARIAARNARLKTKAQVLIALYQAVDPVMTMAYFRLQKAEAEQKDEGAESAEDERGRPLLVSGASERGAFMGNFKGGDRVTLLFRNGNRARSHDKTTLSFEEKSPANVTLCRRRKERSEDELVPLAKVPSLTRDGAFEYVFKEDCAAVLKMDGETASGVSRARFEMQVERGGGR